MINIKRLLAGSAIFIATLSTSACVSVLPEPKPAPTVYRLSIPATASNVVLQTGTVINIEFPQAPRALGGTDIVLSPDGRRLTAAGGASWAEPVPSQIRNVLIDTLNSGGNITGVIPKGSTRAPYRLNIDIRRFEAVFSKGEEAAPNALVQLNLTLTDTNSRRLVGTHSVSTHMWASTKSVSAIVEAQDIATQEAMENITAWLNTLVNNRRY